MRPDVSRRSALDLSSDRTGRTRPRFSRRVGRFLGTESPARAEADAGRGSPSRRRRGELADGPTARGDRRGRGRRRPGVDAGGSDRARIGRIARTVDPSPPVGGGPAGSMPRLRGEVGPAIGSGEVRRPIEAGCRPSSRPTLIEISIAGQTNSTRPRRSGPDRVPSGDGDRSRRGSGGPRRPARARGRRGRRGTAT